MADFVIKLGNGISNGFTIVERIRGTQREYNYLTPNNTLIADKWFCGCAPFVNGFGIVKRRVNGKVRQNYIDPNGNILMPCWAYRCYPFNKNGFGRVAFNMYQQVNYVDANGKFMLKENAKDVEDNDYCCVINIKGRYNLIDKQGNYLLDTWYRYLLPCPNKLIIVTNDEDKQNVIDFNNGLKFISDQWFDFCYDCANEKEDFTIVVKTIMENDLPKGSRYNFIDRNGKLVSKIWFSSVHDFNEEGYAEVFIRNIYHKEFGGPEYLVNYLKRDGNLLYNSWHKFKN